MPDHLDRPFDLGDEERALIVERKATCPFIGSAVNEGRLRVLNDANDPLASIEEVRMLGNTGEGSDLGDVLVLFAKGNHAFRRGDSGRLDVELEGDLFSLDFPGSQGSHPGHSGILQGDPTALGSGRLSKADFERLTSRAQGGLIKRSEVGHFIAENVLRDPNSKVSDAETLKLLGRDLKGLAKAVVVAFLGGFRGSDRDTEAAHRAFFEKLTRLAGEENLVGSAGEFGLLFAFLAHSPRTREVGGEPAVSVEDLRAMFVEKRLPDGWETWKKSWGDWVKSTNKLFLSAAAEYHRLKRAG
ncbi:MAG: hypothetical protein JOZ96_21230 [Acidobacteria bacterium]|nr:hypothetical protein [Acidobacteriota bacterium]